jgi:GDP-4-dehydro-6-deoxy-D-mannose reductase
MKDATTLITGAAGFAGCYLTEALLSRGSRVVGVSRRARWPEAWRQLKQRAELLPCDLTDGQAVRQVLEAVRPSVICHLAGYASVGGSFKDPEAAWQGNLTATRRLLEGVERSGLRPRILWVGSGLIYGQPTEPGPVSESCPLRPDTPYAASKAAADLACFQVTRSAGLEIVRARPFNHTGPHQPADFAIPNWARQLAAIERGEIPPVLEVGDLGTHRDLSDVRDVVDAYLLLLEHGQSGEAYNIGSGVSHSMAEVLQRLIALSGLNVEVRTRADLLRPAEQAHITVDASALRRQTGWAPAHTLDQTLADTLDAWRARPGG